MAKKKRKKDATDLPQELVDSIAMNIEELSEQSEEKSVEEKASETESVLSESEATSDDAGSDVEPDAESIETNNVNDAVEDEEPSSDDLLDDVRQSLIDENAKIEQEKKPSWWQKLGVGKRKTRSSEESIPDVDIPDEVDIIETANVEIEADDQDDAGESIDDLIEMLETEEEETFPEIETDLVADTIQVEEAKPEPEKVDVGELKKRAFSGSTPDDRDENFSEVRAVALEGGEEVFVEVEVKAEDQVEDRIKSFENALRPYRRYINFGIAFIGLVVIVATSLLFYGEYKRGLPPEPTKEVSNLPYPVILNIPGGLSFNLGRGSLDNGRWNPRGPEWLEGTEICRWVAIPYSRQLEAVVRTLTRDDQLELVMSNSDVIGYDVFAITQMSIEDMQNVSSNTPCLLLVLADTKTDTRWVVTSYP